MKIYSFKFLEENIHIICMYAYFFALNIMCRCIMYIVHKFLRCSVFFSGQNTPLYIIITIIFADYVIVTNTKFSRLLTSE